MSRSRRSVAAVLAALVALVWLPLLAGTAWAVDVVLEPDLTVNGCNGVLPTPGSENTTKRLDPTYASDFNPGGLVGYVVDFPVGAGDVGGDFEITDCVYADPPGAGADEVIAKYFVHFVPNDTSFQLRFAVPIPADTPLGSQFCNYAKTTASPSASQASNRKAGPACFTVGGGLRVEKRSGSESGPLLPGASFTVVCTPATTSPPTIVTGLSSQSVTNPDGTVSASGEAADGTIAINGPSGTPCTVTETAAPDGYLVDAAPRDLVIPVGASQTVTVFVNQQLGSLTVEKTTAGAGGTFSFTVTCDDGETYPGFDLTVAADDTDTYVVSESIVAGTECTVAETANALFGTVRTPTDGTVTIDADGETVSFTNTRLRGDLVVEKAADVDGTFTFDVDCSDDAYDASNVSVTTSNGSGSASVDGIPTGVVCTVTEDADAASWTYYVVPADGTVTMDDDGETVTFANLRVRGSLVVTKSVVDATATGPYDFAYHAVCGAATYDFHLGTAGDLGLSHQIDGIPTGTECTVTEEHDATWAMTVTPDDGTVTISSTPATVAFTNTRLYTDVSFAKAADPASGSAVTDGDTITYTLSYANAGNIAAAFAITDEIPAGTTYVTGSAGTGVLADGELTWDIDVPAGGSGTVSFQVTVNAGLADPSTVRNVAVLHEGDEDTPSNETGHPVAHVDISKAVSAAEAGYGDELTYTLTVTNPGAAALTGVVVTDEVPEGTTFVSASDGGTCDDPCTVVTWPGVDMEAGASVTRTFVVTIDTPGGALPATVILNTGAVDSNETPAEPSNEVRTIVTAVQGVKIVDPPALPATGLPNVPNTVALAIALLVAGAGLTFAPSWRAALAGGAARQR